MRRTTYVLFGVLLTLGTTIWAADIDFAGNPQTRDGSLWARKSGTTNTKQDITSHSNALDVNVASGSMSLAGSDADNATNSTTKMPVIPCRANAAAPTWTEGREVPCSVDLSGYERVLDEADYAQGSTTSGQLGHLAQGAVTTAAPTYTTGQTSPLSLTTAGALRTSSSNLPTTVDTGNGATSASTPRVTISNDSTGLIGVQGNVASDAPVTANPLLNGGRASDTAPTPVSTNGDAVALWLGKNGATVMGGYSGAAINPINVGSAGVISLGAATGFGDAQSNTGMFLQDTTAQGRLVGYAPYCFNGTTWDRCRTAGIGNNVASTGIAAAAPYGQYTTNANQPANTTGNYAAAQVDAAGNLRVAPQRPTASDILAANASVTATTASTALITVTAGRQWSGTICASVQGSKAATATGNGEVLGSFLTVGTGAVPAAGTYFEVDTAIGANAATGTVGTNGSNASCSPFVLVAPVGNTVTLNYAATCTSTTACRASFSANGVMQ